METSVHKIFSWENTPRKLYEIHIWEVIAELAGGSGEGESGAGRLEWLEQWWEEIMAKCRGVY